MSEQNNNISYDKVIEYLQEISSKINMLHTCSTNDFNNLSNGFREYFKKTRELSEKAGVIVNKINDKEQSNSFTKIEELYKELFKTQKNISVDIENATEYFENYKNTYSSIYYKIKNYEQNLLGVKLLITNANLLHSKAGIKSLFETESEFNKITTSTIGGLNNIISEFNLFSDAIQKNKSVLEENKRFINENLNVVINQLYSSVIFYSDKQKESIEILPEITEKTKSCSVNLEEIIKYLQYHDIIRQKMEHIHDAQHKLIEELKEVDRKEISKEEEISIFHKISNVANLQSAQLLKANKEYQAAINHIVSKLQNISELGLRIYHHCKSFAQYNKTNENTIYKEFGKKLSDVSQDFEKVNQKIESTYSIVRDYKEDSGKIKEMLNSTFKNTEKLSELLLNFNNIYKENYGVTEIIDKLSEYLEILNKNEEEIISNFNKFIYSSSESNLDAIQKSYKSNEELLMGISGLILDFDKEQKEIDTILNSLNDLSLDLSDGISDSVNKVAYYDCFDKIVDTIIKLLKNIQFNSELIIDDEKELDELKKQYTVKSEHDVHELLLNEENDKEEEKEDDENEVEFF